MLKAEQTNFWPLKSNLADVYPKNLVLKGCTSASTKSLCSVSSGANIPKSTISQNNVCENTKREIIYHYGVIPQHLVKGVFSKSDATESLVCVWVGIHNFDKQFARLGPCCHAVRDKLVEEAQELAEATEPDDVAGELADVLYFAMVRAAKAGVSIDDAVAELDRRTRKVTRRKGDSKAFRIAAGEAILVGKSKSDA